MRRGLLAAAAAAALALGACNKPADKPAAASTATPSASAAAAVSLPTRKPGLWQQTMSRDGQPAMGRMNGMKFCLDAATDAEVGVFGRNMAKDMCQQQSINRGLDGSYSFSSVCNFPGGGKATSKGSASGDFNSKYTVTSETDVEGAPFDRMNGHHKIEVTATWVGPCPADMKGGDVLLPNGMKMSAADIAARREARQAERSAGPGGGDAGGTQ
jgi:hypothetical protein